MIGYRQVGRLILKSANRRSFALRLQSTANVAHLESPVAQVLVNAFGEGTTSSTDVNAILKEVATHKVGAEGEVFCCGLDTKAVAEAESRVTKYVGDTPKGMGYSIKYYRLPEHLNSGESHSLYILTRIPSVEPTTHEATALESVTMHTSSPNEAHRYADLLARLTSSRSPVTEINDIQEDSERVSTLSIAFKKNQKFPGIVARLSSLLRSTQLVVERMTVECFPDGCELHNFTVSNWDDRQANDFLKAGALLGVSAKYMTRSF